MAFSDLLNFTYGELKHYIEFHRDMERKKLQDQSRIAYYQALLIGKLLSEGNIDEVFDCFPYWTEDEILDIRAEQAIQTFYKNIKNKEVRA